MITVRQYAPQDSVVWDSIVLNSRNGNFLHNRQYMEYHRDRFNDASLVVERAKKPIAVFPANIVGSTVISHGGLTYAGLISTANLCAQDTLEVFSAIREHYLSRSIYKLIYKVVPNIFHKFPCQEDLYALSKMGANLTRRDLSSVIDLRGAFGYQNRRKRAIEKAKKTEIDLTQSHNWAGFHSLLCEVLKKFNVEPTHSLDELQLLHSRFPKDICLYEARLNSRIISGVLIYDFGHVVHTQYLASSDEGKECGALDYLLSYLIEEVYCMRDYFSFGISTEDSGKTLNCGLIAQKEGFGARGVVHDTYEWIL